MRFVFLLFLTVPLVEMWVLINVGQQIGVWPTISLVVLTAVVGVQLLRQQGLSTMMRAQQRLATGAVPAQEMLEGLALGVGGALLLTPGFVTDAFGFACLLPWSRRWLTSGLAKRFTVAGVGQNPEGAFYESARQSHVNRGAGQGDEGSVVIEGEFEEDKTP